MSIIGLQRSLHEIGRIRIGEQVATSNGKKRPAKLTSFRLTSRNRDALETAATVYGGEVQGWSDAPIDVQYELYTESSALNVIFPSTQMGFSQFYELWSGGGCQRRCDGQRDTISDSSCICDPDNRQCRETTRLSVILADLNGVGTWRLESHGYYAATELAGIVDVIDGLHSRGLQMLPATLLLEQRQSKRIDQTGKSQTYNYAVPVLDLKMSVAELLGASGGPAISTPTPQLAPGVTPIASDRDDSPLLSVADQMNEGKAPAPRRANASAPLPATGLAPRPAAQADDDRTSGGASKRSVRRLFSIMRGDKSIPKDDEGRHSWAATALGKAVESFNDLSQDDITKLNDVAEGKTARTATLSNEPEYSEDEEPF